MLQTGNNNRGRADSRRTTHTAINSCAYYFSFFSFRVERKNKNNTPATTTTAIKTDLQYLELTAVRWFYNVLTNPQSIPSTSTTSMFRSSPNTTTDALLGAKPILTTSNKHVVFFPTALTTRITRVPKFGYSPLHCYAVHSTPAGRDILIAREYTTPYIMIRVGRPLARPLGGALDSLSHSQLRVSIAGARKKEKKPKHKKRKNNITAKKKQSTKTIYMPIYIHTRKNVWQHSLSYNNRKYIDRSSCPSNRTFLLVARYHLDFGLSRKSQTKPPPAQWNLTYTPNP